MADIGVRFGRVLQNPTIFPEEQGRIQVIVENKGTTRFNGPINLNLYASTDKVLDPLTVLGPTRGPSDRLEGIDELLGRLNNQTVNLAPGASRTFTIDFSQAAFRTASVVAPGVYYLLADVQPGNGVTDTNTTNNRSTLRLTNGDPVIQWDAITLNAIQASGKGALPGTPAPLVGRTLGIVHAAIFDAVNAIDRTYEPYLVNISAADAVGASKEAAAVSAGYEALLGIFTDARFYPDQTFRDTIRATLLDERTQSLAAIPDGPAENKGVEIGRRVASQILAARFNDGAAGASGPYTPGTNFGDWQPTFTDGETGIPSFAPALLPQYGRVTPFAITSAVDFRAEAFPEYGSPRYAREFNEVKTLGAENSTVRSFDQTEIAQFWTYDRDDTFRPPGQLQEAAEEIALASGNTLVQNARLFGLLGLAAADAALVAWDTKYVFEQLRPITAIRNADQDNNPNTIPDPNWEPLLDSPPFPDYISGHSVFAGATTAILRNFFGTDNISFDIPSQELPGVARSFGSLTQLGEEDRLSRLYGGVHIDTATVDGVTVGTNVANFISSNFLTPVA